MHPRDELREVVDALLDQGWATAEQWQHVRELHAAAEATPQVSWADGVPTLHADIPSLGALEIRLGPAEPAPDTSTLLNDLPPDVLAAVRAAVESGMSRRAIAKRFGISRRQAGYAQTLYGRS